MYTVSAGFKTEIKQPSRIISAKVVINNNTYLDDKIVNLSYEDTSNPSTKFEIGTVSAAKVDLTLLGVNEVFETATIKPYIGLDVNGSVEWVPLGTFYADQVDRKKDVTTLTLFDGMIKLEQAYFSNLSYPSTITNVVNEICSKTGFQLAGTLPNYSIEKPEGFTYREVIGHIAALCGGFAKFNRDGKLTIKSYAAVAETITSDHYIGYRKKKDRPYRIDKISVQVGENVLSKGVLGAGGSEITFENPFMTDAILNDVFNKLNGFEYLPTWFKAQGNPAFECGDTITLNTADNEIIKVPVMMHKLSYQGGLTMEIDSEGESESNNQFNSAGSMSKKVERVVYEQALIYEALINKATIEDLQATNARINNLIVVDLTAINADITNLKSNKANITDLTAANARINSLITKDLVAINGKIGTLEAGKANITDLTAAVGRVGILEANVGSINTLLAGNVGAANIAAGAVTAGSGIIAKGAIGDAEISNLSAGKINAGTLDTAKATIAGPNGRLQIKGNKIQIFDDKSGKLYERILLGIDDANNSALTLRGADGTTVLLNQDGLTKAGFTDGFGKVDNDSLDPAKIDINKVVTRINNGTTTIQGSKVFVDGKTLDVSFSTLKSSVTSQGESISSQAAQLSVMDTEIKSKVSSTTYSQDKSALQTDINSRAKQADLDGLQIGGRNLLNNTAFIKDISSWISLGNHSISLEIIDKYNGNNALKIVSTGTGTSGQLVQTNVIGGIKNNQEYMLTFYGKSISGNSSLHTELWGGRGAINHTLTTSWKKFTVKLTGSTNQQNLYFWLLGTGTALLSLPKLEEGNRSTDWTPAPEDVDGQISSLTIRMSTAETNINQTTTDITLKANKTDVYTKTETDGKITSVDNRLKTAEGSITTQAGQISLKANATDVYTKSQVDTSLGGKADNSTVTAVTNRVTTAEQNISALDGKISLRVTKTEFDALSIGGTNLLRNSGFLNGTNEWLANGSTREIVDDTSSKTGKAMKNIANGAGKGIYQRNGSNNALDPNYMRPYENGVDYTVTGWAKTDNTTTTSFYVLAEGTGAASKSITVTTGWSKFEYHFKGNGVGHTVVFYPNMAGTFYFKELKIERGSIATDWTPAPGDTQGQIDGLGTRISTAEASIVTQAGLIASKAESSTVTALGTRVTSAEQNINGLTGEISQRVKTSDYTGNAIASLINQTATTIKLAASKIDLVGDVSIVNGKTVISNLDAGKITTGTLRAITIDGVTIKGSTIESTDAYNKVLIAGAMFSSTDTFTGYNLRIFPNYLEFNRGAYGASLGMNERGQFYLQGADFYHHRILSAQTLENRGFDFILGNGDQDTRGNTGASRAMVKEAGKLVINYGGDFYGGTRVDGDLDAGTVKTTRLMGKPSYGLDTVYLGNVDKGAKIDISGGIARWQQHDANYLSQSTNGDINFYMGGTYKHVFFADGRKVGGSIEIDEEWYGMSPIDSPQILIEYVEFDIPLDFKGTKVFLDDTYRKAVANFAVFANNGQVIEKGYDYFVIAGEGVADCRVIGERIGSENVFWADMTYNLEKLEEVENEPVEATPETH